MPKYLQGISPATRPGQPSSDPRIRKRLDDEYQERRKAGLVPSYSEQLTDEGPPPPRDTEIFGEESKLAAPAVWKMLGTKENAGSFIAYKKAEQERGGVKPPPRRK